MLNIANENLARPVEGPVDKKSGQVINQEIMIAQQGRTKVKNNGPFNEYTAQAELNKHLKKDKKKSPVMFLIDRMRFTRKGYHEYVSYRDIEHFYQPPGRPDTFMLYVKDSKGRKSYETYKCSTPQDVERAKELIFTAGYDRKKILSNGEGYMRQNSYSTSSTESSEYYVERRSHSALSRPRSTTLPSYQTIPSLHYQPIDAQPSPTPVYRKRASYAVSAEPRYETYRAPSVRSSKVNMPARQSFAPNEVTYLRTDNVRGPQIMDNGPVYMYVSRSRPAVNRSSWSSDSSPVQQKSSYYR